MQQMVDRHVSPTINMPLGAFVLEKALNIRQLLCRCLQLSSQLQWNQSVDKSIVPPQGRIYLSETKILGFVQHCNNISYFCMSGDG